MGEDDHLGRHPTNTGVRYRLQKLGNQFKSIKQGDEDVADKIISKSDTSASAGTHI